MANSGTQELLNYAHLQMAAEAYLEALPPKSESTYRADLINALTTGNDHASAFPRVLAEEFADSFEIVAHQKNTDTGFSGTLFRSRITDPTRGLVEGQYTLSFRSTEFVEDAIQDATGAGSLEIRSLGWALGQLADMESWYKELKAAGAENRDLGLPPDTQFSVTGYSLGGHLATAFAILRREEAARIGSASPVAHVYTFNGAGTGGVRAGRSLAHVVDRFDWLSGLEMPAGGTSLQEQIKARGRTLEIQSEWRRLDSFKNKATTFANGEVPPQGDYGTFQYQLAAVLVSSDTIASSNFPLPIGDINTLALKPTFAKTAPFENMTEVVGAEGGQNGTDLFAGRFSFVSFSGQHYSKPENYLGVYIEDQPLFRGNYGLLDLLPPKLKEDPDTNSFADTHSLVLLVDSLALMATMSKLDQTISQKEIETIFKAASSRKSKSIAGSQGEAEGDTLELVLDGLRRLFVDGNAEPTRPGLTGNTWHDLDLRQAYHFNIRQLESSERFQSATGRVTIRAVAADALQIGTKARESVEYRYALATLNPFVVEGDASIYQLHNANGELDLFNPESGEGRFTTQYISDRSGLLAERISLSVANSTFDRSKTAQSDLYFDKASGQRASLLAKPQFDMASNLAELSEGEVKVNRLLQQMGYDRRFVFGLDDSILPDHLEGSDSADNLYGAGGNDKLIGAAGADYLQGDAGDDRLFGGTGDDRLVGGKGDDRLHGGTGTDKYYFYKGGGADTVIDEAEIVGTTKRQLGEIYFGGAAVDVRIAGMFTALDPDAKQFRLDLGADAYFAAYQGDVATATPGKLFLYKGTDGSNVVTLEGFVSGDFGIELSPDAPQRTYTDKQGTELPDNDFLIGTPHASALSSDSPDQKVFGLGGADYIVVAHANAQAIGGEGNDFLTNGPGDQGLFGEAGRDVILATAGEDRLEGGADDDALQGGADADVLDGGSGNDVLDGGAGADVLSGGDGHDFLFGGGSVTVHVGNWDAFADGSLDWGAVDASGNVLLRGLVGLSNIEGDAGDVITAGAGNDWAFAGDGADVVSGGEGNDTLIGQAGGDALSGDEGDDRLYGDGAQGDLTVGTGFFSVFTLPPAHGDDALRGGEGNDYLSGDGGADDLRGDAGDDTLVGDSANVPEQFHGADMLDGGDGNDVLLGYGKGDFLLGGAGNDQLGGDSSAIASALHGDDTLDGGDGDDTLHGDGGADQLFGGTGNDVLDGDASNVAFEHHGIDTLDGGDGNDALQGGGGADWLFGGTGNDSLVGDGPAVPAEFAGADYLDGEAGSDVLEGGAGNDTLLGGAGSDILRGQAGDDLYVLSAGDQQDFIQDQEGANTIRFDSGGSFASMSVFQFQGTDGKTYLEIRHTPLDSAYVENGLTSTAFRYEFADGVVRSAADWRSKFTSFTTVSGTSGADDLAGTARAESYSPGNGNDTIRFAPGSGFDRVSGFGQVSGQSAGLDVVRVGGGLTAADFDVRRDSSNHLSLTLRASGDVLRLDNWGTNVALAHAGHQVVFDDGTGLTAADLIALAAAGTGGADFLAGGAGADVIDGGAGDDRIFGNSNSNPQGGAGDANVLLGGEGNDQISGGHGDDLIDGGPGDDTLSGGEGLDTYRWGIGGGNDTITDAGGGIVELHPGLAPDDVTLVHGSIVVYINATGESLTLNGWGPTSSSPTAGAVPGPVQELRFADGTVWDASLINERANHATPFDDLLIGLHGADVLHGLGGNDELLGNAGDDVLYGGVGVDDIEGDWGADELVGGEGNDFLSGAQGADLLVGGAGDDLLSGESGYDTFLFGMGDGIDRIQGGGSIAFDVGIDPADVRLTSDGTTFTIDYGSGRATVQLGTSGNHAAHGITDVRFAGGVVWEREEVLARTEILPKLFVGTDSADTLVGGAGDDFLDGGAGDDTLSGNAGNDFLDGGAGDDSLQGGLGSDTYRLGPDTGYDVIFDARRDLFHTSSWPGDLDVVLVDGVLAPEDVQVFRSGNSLVIASPTSGVSVLNWNHDEFGTGPLAVRFADGTEWDSATLMALAGFEAPGSLDDVLTGTPGDDLLRGGYGNDTYLFGFGSGNDTIDEPGNTLSGEIDRATAGERDTIRFGPGVRPEDVSIEFDYDRPVFRLAGAGDSLSVTTWSDAATGRVEFAEFEDGTVWDLGRFDYWSADSPAGVGVPLIVTGSDRHFPGASGAGLGMHDEIYFGGAAGETVSDIHGHQVLFGGAGNDTLSGGNGDDTHDGGAGNDTLNPGTGNNRIRFEPGAGQDTLNRFSQPTALGVDTIVLSQEVTPGQVRLRRGIGESVILELAGTPDSLRINGPLRGLPGGDRLRLEFADGTVWGADEIEANLQLVSRIEGGTGNNVLVGGDGDDYFIGGEGNDTLTGGGGVDSFLFNRGDGEDTIVDAHPRIVFGEGIAPADVSLVATNIAGGQRDLHLSILGNGGVLRLVNWFNTNGVDGRLEFADGTVWDAATIGAQVPFAWVSGTSGSFFGTSGADAYSAGAANDSMRGFGGADVLAGNDGNDQVFGGEGHDLLTGGAGNDTLQGDAGMDELRGGEGNDSLRGDSDADALHGDAGDDLLTGGTGDDLLSGGGGNDRLAGDEGDDALHGGDGIDILEGGLGSDFLDGGAGIDRLYGGVGSDTYAFGIGSGQDTLLDFDANGADVDTVLLGAGVAPEDLVVTRRADDVVLSIGAAGDSLAIRSFGRAGYGIEQLVFADGTVWSGEELSARAAIPAARDRADVLRGTAQAEVLAGLGGDDFIDGGAGNDLIEGGAGDDVIWGGAGDDTLEGGEGSDHLTGGEGTDLFLVLADSGSDTIADLLQGDVLQFGASVSPESTRIERDVDNLYLESAATGQFVTLEGWFAQGAGGEVLFDDGTRWDGDFLLAHVHAQTDGDDFIVGTAAAETLAPLAGLDVVHAGGGDDLVLGGAGADTLHGDSGADALYGEAGYDLLSGGAGDDLLEGGADDDALFGDEGNDILRGGEGYDELTGGSGDDVLEGGADDDVLQGGFGSDVYLFAAGFGSDSLLDSSSGTTDINVARFSGIDPAGVSFVWDSNGFLLGIEGSTDRLLMRDSAIAHWFGVETLEFDDGTVWRAADVYARSIRIGTEGNDFLSGDFVEHHGLSGNDTLTGGFGDNALFGGEGNDTLDARQGNDLMVGGAGADTYVFRPTFGHDVIQEDDAGVAGADTITLNAALADSYIYRDGQDIVIALAGGADTLTLQSWYDGPAHQIELLRFSNGSTWSAQTLETHASANPPPQVMQVAALLAVPQDDPEPQVQQAALAAVAAVQGFTAGPEFVRGSGGDDLMDTLDGDDSAYGGPGNDWLIGGEGDDYLAGEAGNDLLDGGTGRDILEGAAGNDSYAFGAGYGEDWAIDTGGVDEVLVDATLSVAAVVFSRDLSNLTVAAGTDRLTLVDWFHRAETRIETFRFADGTVLDEAAVRLALAVPAASASHDTIFGSDRGEALAGLAGEDALYGEGGDDVLDGGPGSDYMLGGAGDDTYYVDNRLDRATERPGEGSDTVIATVSHELAPDVENLVLSGAAAISGTGNAGANAITGNAAANVLRGAGGDDLLRGGAGNDVYLYGAGDGNDRIEDVDATPGNVDELRFGAGILSAGVRVRRAGQDLHVLVHGGAEVVLAGWDEPAMRVEIVRFADDTAWDAAMLDQLASLPWNEPPELALPIADAAALEDAPFTLALQPGTFSDPDATDALAYSAMRADGSPLPTWLQFDTQTARFAGTPGNGDVGEYAIRVFATDPAGESAADEFALTVVNVNDAPTLQGPLADRSVAAGDAFALALDEAMFADVDAGDTLSYGAARADGSALPSWLGFDTVARTFSGTPGDSDAGAYDIRVTATDLAGVSANDEFRITVTTETGAGEHLIGTRHADVLVGTRHDDVLEGRGGNDLLLGLQGDDAYVHESGDGHDWILESSGTDVVRFGAGIRERDVTAMRRHGDLVLKVRGDQGSVTVKDWFLAESKRVERVEFASGRSWDENELRSRARRWHDDGWYDGPPHHHRGHDHHYGGRRDDDHGGWKAWGDGRSKPRDACDLIDARLKRAVHYDFSALLTQLRRDAGGGGDSSGSHAVHRWEAIRRMAALLARGDAQDAAGGWDGDRERIAYASEGSDASGWGHAGSTGQRAGIAGLRAFGGLDEGFRKLA